MALRTYISGVSLSAALLASTAAMGQDSGGFVLREIVFVGNTLVEEEILDQSIAVHLGQTLTVETLNEITSQIGFTYRDLGYWAAAYLPEQTIDNGTLTIGVVEAVSGEFRAKMDTERSKITEGDILSLITSGQSRGAFLDMEKLEYGIGKANEIAGVNVTANLGAGKAERETDVDVVVTDSELLAGSIVLDNHATSGARLSGRVGWESPFGYGEAFNLSSQISRESFSLDFASSIGVNGNRQKLQFELGYSGYRLGGEFAALDMTGNTKRAEISLQNINIDKSGDIQSQAQVSFSRVNSTNKIGSLTQTSRLTSLTTQVDISAPATRQRDASFEAQIAATLGRLDLGVGSLSYEKDQASRRSNGTFAKLLGSLQAEIPIQTESVVTLDLRGQLASKNLDSAQKLVVAGPTALQSLSIGELSVDDGFIGRLSYARNLEKGVKAIAFGEGAFGRINHQTWSGWDAGSTDKSNTFRVLGIGAGLNIPFENNLSYELSAAVPISTNLVGISKAPRLWAQVAFNF